MNCLKNAHRNLVAVLSGIFFLVLPGFGPTAQAQCTTGCTTTLNISGTNSTNINAPGNNTTICITGSGTYTGTVDVRNRNMVRLCVGPGVTFSAAATLNWNNNFTINNYGVWQQPINMDNDVTLNNYGSIYINGSWTLGGGTINSPGSVTVTGNLQANPGTYHFNGVTTIGGNFQTASGVTMTFGNGSSINGNFDNNSGSTINLVGSLSIGGNAANGGTITSASSSGSCVGMFITGNVSNSGGTISAGPGKTFSLNKAPTPAGSQTNTQILTVPAAQPGALTLTSTGPNTYSGSFTAASPAPGGYVVLRKRGSGLAAANYPPFGSSVTVGGYVNGAKVLAVLAPANRTFTDAPDSCGTYYYTVLSMSNSTGTCAAFAAGASPSAGTAVGNPNASTIAYSSPTYCQAQPLTNVTRSGAGGGTYSVSPGGMPFNNTTGAINPSAAIANSYTVTYTVPARLGCPVTTATASVQVVATPTATITYPASSYCRSASPVSVTHAGVTGGTYSSSVAGLTVNGTSGQITPSSSAAGSYTVRYTVAATTSCPARTYTTPMAITATPTNTITYPNAAYCTGAAPQSVTLTGGTGGTYSASPAGMSIDTASGQITPASSAAGNYTVTYTAPASATCPRTPATRAVAISAPPSATIAYPAASYCTSASVISVNRSGTTGGTYSVAPAGLTISSTSGAVTPASSAAGSYTVTYTMAATPGCPTQTTTTTLAIATPGSNSIMYDRSEYCASANSGSVALTGPTGGTYSASPAGLTIDAGTGEITPSASAIGSYTVTYSAPASATCPITPVTSNISVTPGPATFVWQGGSSSSMLTPNNWSPSRGSINSCDILDVPTGGNVTINTVSTQTILKIIVRNNTNLTLSASGNAVLNLTGYNGISLEVEQGSSITLSGSQFVVNAQSGSLVQVYGTLGLDAATLNISGASLVLASTSASYVPLVNTGGLITTSATTNLSFGAAGRTGMANTTLPAGLFTANPVPLGNLNIETASNTIALADQDLSVHGTFSRPSGAGILQLNGRTLSLHGGTSGTPTVEDNTASSTLSLHGSGDLSGLRFAGASPYLHNLTMNRTYARASNLPAASNLTIGGAVTLTRGIVNTGSNKIVLATTAALSTETDSSYIRGIVEQTRNLAQNTLYTFSGMRLTMRAIDAAPGLTTLTRINSNAAFLGIDSSVHLRYIIDAAVDVGLNATLTMKVLNSELNAHSPSNLIMARLPDGSWLWEPQELTQVNAGALTYTLQNIPSFSTWTLGDPMEILPVTLVKLEGKASPEGQVEVRWETLSEEDNAGFALFRQRDGLGAFDSLAFIEPIGPTDGNRVYRFVDRNPGIRNVYRLRQYDLSGKVTTFPLLYVRSGKAARTEEGTVAVFPNPMEDDRISVMNRSAAAQTYRLALRDANGALIYQGQASLPAGNTQAMELPRLSPGFYLLEVTGGPKGRQVLKLVRR